MNKNISTGDQNLAITYLINKINLLEREVDDLRNRLTENGIKIPEREIWADVVGHEGYYQVSTHGNIKNYSGQILPSKVQKNGYLRISLYVKGGKYNVVSVHRLVASAFISNPQNKRTVNHKDGNRVNNHVDNLEWNTYFENMYHCYKDNKKKNKNNPYAVSPEQVREMRRLNKSGKTSKELAEFFGVSYGLVRRIVLNETWKEII